MPRLSDADIRDGLQILRRHYIQTFQKQGMSEAEAKRKADRELARTSGNRVRANHHHDGGKEKISNRWRDAVREEQRQAEEAQDDAEILAARDRGRIVIGGT